MAKFEGRRGDLKWGKYDYPVTKSQWCNLMALEGLFKKALPPAIGNPDLWKNGYYSQDRENGDVIIGFNNEAVRVTRSGQVNPSNVRVITNARILYVSLDAVDPDAPDGVGAFEVQS